MEANLSFWRGRLRGFVAVEQPFQLVTEIQPIHSPIINQNSPRRDKVIVARTNTSKRKVITRQSQFNRRKPSTNSVAVQLNPGFPERDPNARV